MVSKHRMPHQPTRMTPANTRRHSRANLLIGTVSAAVAGAGILSGAIVHIVDPGADPPPRPSVSAPAPQQPAQPLNQEGTIIAVSGDSVTARSPSGFTQTYQVTGDTAVLSQEGAQTPWHASPFVVDDEVAIVATLRDGTAVATAVADRARTHLNGPPMDSVDVQPASTDAGHRDAGHR